MKKLLSVFLCVMMVLLMSVTPAALAQEEELSKDVTINVYSWWDPTKVGMVNLKDGFEKKYADKNVKIEVVAQEENDSGTQVLSDSEAAADVFSFLCKEINNLCR